MGQERGDARRQSRGTQTTQVPVIHHHQQYNHVPCTTGDRRCQPNICANVGPTRFSKLPTTQSTIHSTTKRNQAQCMFVQQHQQQRIFPRPFSEERQTSCPTRKEEVPGTDTCSSIVVDMVWCSSKQDAEYFKDYWCSIIRSLKNGHLVLGLRSKYQHNKFLFPFFWLFFNCILPPYFFYNDNFRLLPSP